MEVHQGDTWQEPSGTSPNLCTGTFRNLPEPHLKSEPEPSGTSPNLCTGTFRNLTWVCAPEPSGTSPNLWTGTIRILALKLHRIAPKVIWAKDPWATEVAVGEKKHWFISFGTSKVNWVTRMTALPEWLKEPARVAGAATQPLSHSARVAGATQPFSHSARVAGAATQPLSQSGWSSQLATQPLCQSGCSHSATRPLSHSARAAKLSHPATLPVAGAATQPLCQSGWRSHSATLAEWLSGCTKPLWQNVSVGE